MSIWLLLVWFAGPYDSSAPPVFTAAFESKSKCEKTGAALKAEQQKANWTCQYVEVKE